MMLHYAEIFPPPLLQRHVECFWTLRSGSEATRSIRILPDGCMDLIFNFADPIRNPETRTVNSFAMFVVGNMTHFSLAATAWRFDLLGIRFKPGGMYPFLNQPLFYLTDRIVEGNVLGTHLGDRLYDRIADLKSDQERIETLQTALLWRLRQFSDHDRIIDFSVRQILSHEGTTRIDQLARRCGISQRQLERKFKVRVGLSPKQLSQIVRFRHAQLAVKHNPTMSLLNLAYDFGYFDHAHLTRDFRRFAGITPSDIQKP